LEATQHAQSTYLSFLCDLLEVDLSERKCRNLKSGPVYPGFPTTNGYELQFLIELG